MGTDPARVAALTAYAQSLIKTKARQLSRNPTLRGMDPDDIAQELVLVLLSRAHKYDPARGASRDTFADRVINSAIATLLRDQQRQKRAGNARTVSINQSKTGGGDESATLGELLSAIDGARRAGTDPDEKAELIEDLAEALWLLPPDLQIVCRKLMDQPEASVARDMGMSRRQTRKAMARIRSHFETSGFGDS